ncbi:NAPDH-dependent diflavin reductase [Coemansia sp. RSA 1822]|nr:NAPDH-dependent diflavin reductase [Coemansia sp. RSA 638]KAJ2542425.1 NAPDH-dependent diflavin reductase [Coemansia sp. RSA 1853]KAJ2562521.1 NAPDH-dependent diflavin reductase [Coemansia sp. RSA 1822]
MTERRLLILYGSQTGYAKDTAYRIARQAWRRHFSVSVQSMDQVDKWSIFTATYPVIFVCSTTGQGEEPDNMKKLWRFILRKTIPHDALSGLQYAVFGLGDSSYQKFNFPAKRLFRRLQQLGGTPIVDRGDGDDQHYLGLDGALDPWLENLWTVLLDQYPLPKPIVPESVAPDPSCDIDYIDECIGASVDETELIPGTYLARLVKSDRMTAPDHFQDVHLFEFELDDSTQVPRWSPGDCAVLRPENLDSDVNDFLQQMRWAEHADRLLQIKPHDESIIPEWVPRRTTLRWLFTYYFDIMAVPRRSFFEMLYFFSSSENEKERLHEFTTSEGQDELQTYCMRPRRTIVEVLDDLPCSRVPLEYIFDVFPEIADRSFSISSASAVTPHRVDLTVAIVNYKTLMQKPRVGVCTKWLLNMELDRTVGLRFAKGTMKLPAGPTPIIMVGPGTGIAAFMSFIGDRVSRNISANYLFFGCRNEHGDFLHQEQLQKWISCNELQLFCAFSRDQENTVYVQQRIREQGDLLWSLISEQDAVVYVSGNANRMPDDVRQAFTDVVADHGVDDAAAYVQAMVKTGRYQEECWY